MGGELVRLKAMTAPNQLTWDLSFNDTAAIRWAIDRIEAAKAPPDTITLDGHEYVRLVLCPRAADESPAPASDPRAGDRITPMIG